MSRGIQGTKYQFVEKSKKFHGDKYDYSLVEYKNLNTPVKIICPEHGVFEQTPLLHSNRCGCPECSNKVKNTEHFIRKANEIHNNKYDYSKSVYVDAKTPITIICPIHGEILQKSRSHLTGCGCQKCGREKAIESIAYSKDEFIKKVSVLHKNKYDYSLANYNGIDKKIKIICPTHGVFEQTPNSHIKHGCPHCGHKKSSESRFYTKEFFIQKAIEFHGDTYDYSKVVYVNSKSKVIITCKTHGDFLQTPRNHMVGNGCPSCKTSKGENYIRDFLKNNKIKFEPQKKFPGCRYKNLLSFDFYLTNLNACIEYDGEQHYKPIKGRGGEVAYKEIKKRDSIKTKFCKQNSIPLLRIKYNENIEKKLENFLEKLF